MPTVFTYDSSEIVLRYEPEKTGLLARVFSNRTVPFADRDEFVLALADLRAVEDALPGAVTIDADGITLSHQAAAMLPGSSAQALGLPRTIDLTLSTDVSGLVGSKDFRLTYQWQQGGRRVLTRRTGAIIETPDGARRLPSWILQAIEIADGFDGAHSEADAWGALAAFRQALDPGDGDLQDQPRLDIADFLSGLKVRIADSFSISPQDGDTFDILPFSRKDIDALDHDVGPTEGDSELSGAELQAFQTRVANRGALQAYKIGDGSYLVVERSVAPVLRVMAEMQRAPKTERAAFIRNPREKITAAIADSLSKQGKFEGLDDDAQEELVEELAGPAFVETREYSERVTGIVVWTPPAIDIDPSGSSSWLPEVFTDKVAETIRTMPWADVESLHETMSRAFEAGQATVDIGGDAVTITPQTIAAVKAELLRRDLEKSNVESTDEEFEDLENRPKVLDTENNFETVAWRPKNGPRMVRVSEDLPKEIRTPLKQHQLDSFAWQIKAWKAGLPGVLNADEQGLGKTLQTIAFLVWLKSQIAMPGVRERGPALIVAPTSLLKTWEEEVARHVEDPGLGHLVRLYGSGTQTMKQTGQRGRDIETGEAKLDFSWLDEALNEERGHRYWVLTTYTTLTNYQHSLGRVPFSVAVFDEVQAVKNPASLRASAARAMKADFRIALTGTPIENSTTDLWAIMDQVAPGALGSLREFRSAYGTPTAKNMRDLHERLFYPQEDLPALALRRLKDEVAKDLPKKERRLHPAAMPTRQAQTYEEARALMAGGSKGSALKMLHHIRSVSVHPSVDDPSHGAEYISISARLEQTFQVLDEIRHHGERALVFIESLKMQYRFAELARRRFELDRIDIINGSTPIPRRQEIVTRFQRHLERDRGFDLLVLGPRAAGTGLTLTAATHVIHLSRWWNPAVEEQCNDRVHRLGQSRPVTVHMPMAIHPSYREHSFDCLLHSLMQRKRHLAASALWPMGDTDEDAAQLQKLVSEGVSPSDGDPVESALKAMFQRDGAQMPRREADGSRIVH